MALVMAISTMVFGSNVYASGGLVEDEGKIIIPFVKNWDENVSEDSIPASVEITLYRYTTETFDIENAEIVEVANVTEEDDWKYNFDISDVSLVDSNFNFYKFSVVETPINGFEEKSHNDPNVIFTPPSVGEGWDKIEPCNNLNITVTGEYKSIIFMKKGSKIVVWSVEPLSDSERELVFSSAKNIPGMGNPSFNNATFISGINGSYSGMTVLENHVNFEATNNWSLIAVGLYNKSTTETNSSQITNTAKLVNYTVKKIWTDDNNIEKLRPTSVSVDLLANGEKVQTIDLSSENGWSHIFNGLKEYDSNGEKIKYTVSESPISGYTPTYKYDTDNNSVTIENVHKVEYTSIKVIKKWINIDIFRNNMPKIKLSLFYKENKNDSDWTEISNITLTGEGDVWEYTWTKADGFDKLPSSFIYKVEEVGFTDIKDADYIFEHFFDVKNEQDGNTFTITNKCKVSFELPETGSSKMLFIIIAVAFLIGMPSIYMLYSFIKKYI